MTRIELRTLRCHLAARNNAGIEAEIVAVCSNCASRWTVNIRRAIRHLGETATTADLIDRHRCQHCDGGVVAFTYTVIDTAPPKEPQWFAGMFHEVRDGEPTAGVRRRRQR